MVEEKKIEEKKLRKSQAYAFIPVTDFPLNMYEEWRKDCKRNFNDCFWQKVWTDHLKAKITDSKIEKAMLEDDDREDDDKDLCLGGHRV